MQKHVKMSLVKHCERVPLAKTPKKMQYKSPAATAFFFFSLISLLLSSNPTESDSQANLLSKDCVHYDDIVYNQLYKTFIAVLAANLNSTLSDLRSQLLTSSHFATAHHPNIYALFQCRDYLSISDCLSCFSSAASWVQRNCPAAGTSRVYYDGCFLRYEGEFFFDEATQPGDAGFCGNRTVVDGNDFNRTADMLLRDLVVATPRSRGFFTATKRDGSGGDIVYGVAQCVHTVNESGCQECLQTAYGNIQKCPPSADGRAIDVGCFLRFSDTAFFRDDQVTDIATLLRNKGGKYKKSIIIIVVAVALVLLAALAFLIFFLLRRKRTQDTLQEEIMGPTELQGPMNFHYHELKSATRNFSKENKVGEGGFGDVYLGIMRNGKKVAVKRLAIDKSRQIQADFQKEVTLINNVRHRNLVRLLGCCSKGPEYLLVYEYMANSSLDKFLFGNRRGSLNWKQRFDIIVGTARGLAYLHEEFHVCIIHRDIKSNNILLDDELQPKIADFGLARLLPADQTHLNTRSAGTLGYMAPEYALLGKLSEKVDVYSYGVVVLEIISGQKSSDVKFKPIMEYLLNWAWRLYEEGSLMELVDENLDLEEYETDEVQKVIEIALMCTQSVTSRPSMSEVVVWLLNKDKLGAALTCPNFINTTNTAQNRVPQKDASSSSGSSLSNATMSITRLSAR